MKEYYSLGIMSGSSIDGLDIAYSKINSDNNAYSYQLYDCETISFPPNLLDLLTTCRNLSSRELYKLDISLGEFIGQSCFSFLSKNKINTIDFIASHGHTVFHFPDEKITCQIGNGHVISKICQIPIINNFREKDIIHNGSGAPIIPILDKYLFPNYKYCLNLGGIMNISIKINSSIISYDIGACNQVLNHYAQKLNIDYDKDGFLASQGILNLNLYNTLNAQLYFTKNYPKSLDNSFSSELISIIDSFSISIKDILSTFCHHIAYQIDKQIDDKQEKIILNGGGSHHSFLISILKNTYKLNVFLPEEKLINFKEALAMSFLGVRRLENKANVLKSVTGADIDTICGDIYYP